MKIDIKSLGIHNGEVTVNGELYKWEDEVFVLSAVNDSGVQKQLSFVGHGSLSEYLKLMAKMLEASA